MERTPRSSDIVRPNFCQCHIIIGHDVEHDAEHDAQTNLNFVLHYVMLIDVQSNCKMFDQKEDLNGRISCHGRKSISSSVIS